MFQFIGNQNIFLWRWEKVSAVPAHPHRANQTRPMDLIPLTDIKTKKKKKKASSKEVLGSLGTAELDSILTSIVDYETIDMECNASHLESLEETIDQLTLELEDSSEDNEDSPCELPEPVSPKKSSPPPNLSLATRQRSSGVIIRPGLLIRPHRPPPMSPAIGEKKGRVQKPPNLVLKKKPPPVPPRRDSNAVSDTSVEERKRQERAASLLRKKLMQENALASDSMFRARRYSVAQTPSQRGNPVSAVQVEVEELRERSRSSTVSASPDQLFQSQKKRLNEKLQATLKDNWRVDLFRRFLQEKQSDSLLDFYQQVQLFEEKVASLENMDTESEEFIEKRNELRADGRGICTRFVEDTAFPKKVKTMLGDTTWGLLVPLKCDAIPVDDFEELDSGTDTMTFSASETSEEDESGIDVPELDADYMELLSTDDPQLFKR